jgi:hypothetical protein
MRLGQRVGPKSSIGLALDTETWATDVSSHSTAIRCSVAFILGIFLFSSS